MIHNLFVLESIPFQTMSISISHKKDNHQRIDMIDAELASLKLSN
jgi:hypothetical protein